MAQIRTEPIKGYVEPKIAAATERFAREHGMSVSTAVRFLVLQGLREERRKKDMIAVATGALDAAIQPRSIAS